MKSGKSHWFIDIDAVGNGSVIVDGIDISNKLDEIEVISRVGNPTLVVAHFVAASVTLGARAATGRETEKALKEALGE